MRLICINKIKMTIFAVSTCLPSAVLAENTDYQSSIDNHQAQFEKVALELWNFAELGYQETRSSSLLQAELKKEGFTITSGIADIASLMNFLNLCLGKAKSLSSLKKLP